MPTRFPGNLTLEAFRLMFEELPSTAFLLDRRHELVAVNKKFVENSGAKDTGTLVANGFVSKKQLDELNRLNERLFLTGENQLHESTFRDLNGDTVVAITRKHLVHLPTERGVEPFILGVATEVTALKQNELKAQALAERDGLTGLLNRTGYERHLAEALDVAQEIGCKIGMLVLDLDGFKSVNDAFGHAAGDTVLCEVGRRIAHHVRSSDGIARLGGDEFAILLSPLADAADAEKLAERIIHAVREPIPFDSVVAQVSASIGISVHPDDSSDPGTLYRLADRAMYDVKRAGKNGSSRVTRITG